MMAHARHWPALSTNLCPTINCFFLFANQYELFLLIIFNFFICTQFHKIFFFCILMCPEFMRTIIKFPGIQNECFYPTIPRLPK